MSVKQKILKYTINVLQGSNKMRFNDFFESIRMGKRELSSPPKKNYTIGFEFEILASGDNYDPSDEYARFSENWHNNNDADFETFFNDHWMNGRSNITTLNRELGFDLQPKFGWASEYDYEKTMRIIWYIDGISDPEMKKEAIELNKLSKNADNLSEDEIESTFKRIYSITNFSEIYDKLQPSRKERVDGLYEYRKDNNNLIMGTIKNLPSTMTFLDDMNFDKEESTEYYWSSEDKEKIFGDISTLDDIVNYFLDGEEEISRETMENTLENEYFEWIDDQINNDFSEYMNSGKNGAVQEIANDLENYVDQGIIKHSAYHETAKNPNKWTVEPDGSIEGAEVVSPVFENLDEAFKNMHSVFEMISDSYGTDRTTGLHVNIGTFSKEDLARLDLLKFLLIVGGENILEDFKRQNNEYTMNNMQEIYYNLIGGNAKDDTSKINISIIDRAKKMNLFNFSKLRSHGYIEVRGFGNAGYETKGDLIENYIRKILRSLDIAMDPNAYKETYLKFLTKAITKANPPQFSSSDNRALEKYKQEHSRITNQKLRIRPYHISEDMVDSYRTLMDIILNENEYDMIFASSYKTLANIHSIMKIKDDGNYRRFLSKLIRDFKPIVTEFKNLSSKKDRTTEEKDRFLLIKPVAEMLKILIS